MNITKVTYQKAFVVGPYLQEKIGIEIEIDSRCGEMPEFALDQAKEIVEKWHKDNNPSIEASATIYGPPPVIEKEEPSAGLTPELLFSCTDIVTLQSFYLLVNKSNRVDLVEAFNTRKSQLVEKETKELLEATDAHYKLLNQQKNAKDKKNNDKRH